MPKRLPAPIKAILNKTIFKKDPTKPIKQLDNKNKPTNNRLNKESIKNNVKRRIKNNKQKLGNLIWFLNRWCHKTILKRSTNGDSNALV